MIVVLVTALIIFRTSFQSKTCEAYVANEAFITGFSASLGLPKGSPLKDSINRM